MAIGSWIFQTMRLNVEKIEHDNLEMIVANDIGKGGIGTEESDVYILQKVKEKARERCENTDRRGDRERVGLYFLVCGI